MVIKAEYETLNDLFKDISESGIPGPRTIPCILSHEQPVPIVKCEKLHPEDMKMIQFSHEEVYKIMMEHEVLSFGEGWKPAYRDVRLTYEENEEMTSYYMKFELLQEDDYDFNRSLQMMEILNSKLSLKSISKYVE